MVHVPALAKLAHQLGLEAFVLQDAFIARGHEQPLHADGAILKEPTDGHSVRASNSQRVHQGVGTNLLNLDIVFLTSSGNTLIFSVYLFTTSSGFFPSHTNKSEGKKWDEKKKKMQN